MNTEQQQAQDMIRRTYEDGFAVINGRKYEFQPMRHIERRKVFAFTSRVAPDLERGDMGFLDGADWADIERLLWTRIVCDGRVLSQEPEYWETFPEDYLLLIQTALMVISYPFLRGASTGSRSNTPAPQVEAAPRSRKPM